MAPNMQHTDIKMRKKKTVICAAIQTCILYTQAWETCPDTPYCTKIKMSLHSNLITWYTLLVLSMDCCTMQLWARVMFYFLHSGKRK